MKDAAPFGILDLQARSERNKNPPSPKVQVSDQHVLLGLRVTIKFIDIPVIAPRSNSIQGTRSAKTGLVRFIRAFLFDLELRAVQRRVRKCLATGIT